MKTILGTIVGGLLVVLGAYIREQRKPQSKQELYCANIELHQHSETVFHAEPCMNKASVIIGCKTLCDDHLDVYLSEMTGTLEE